MIKLKNITHPIYLARRLKYKVYEITHPGEPWIAQGAIRFCSDHLSETQIGFEWGSGRSTIWFGKRLKSLTSIEHNLLWHTLVSKRLKEEALDNVDYRLIPLDHDPNEPTCQRYDVTPAYVSAVNEFDDEALDFAV